MSKVYIVTGSCGEYSDRNDWNICALHSKELAVDFADKLRRLQIFRNEFHSRMLKEFDEPYKERERLSSPDKPAVTPAFRRLMDIASIHRTEEDRADFRRLQAEHMQRLDVWKAEERRIGELNNSLWRAKEVARAHWAQENYKLPDDLNEVAPYGSTGIPTYDRGVRYSYDEIDLL